MLNDIEIESVKQLINEEIIRLDILYDKINLSDNVSFIQRQFIKNNIDFYKQILGKLSF